MPRDEGRGETLAVPADALPSARVVWAARFGGMLLRLLGATWRYRVTNDEAVRRLRVEGTPIVFSLWHGQLLPLLYHHRGQGVAVLISEHADGEIIARIATALGYRTVRGSTSRGAARALIGLTRVVRDRGDLAVTPDGPRGPAKSFAPGVAIVARKTGAPVIGAAAAPRRAWYLKSWDRFQIPRPFTTIRVAYSDPVYVAGQLANVNEPANDPLNDSPQDATTAVGRLQAAMALAEARASV